MTYEAVMENGEPVAVYEVGPEVKLTDDPHFRPLRLVWRKS
jgi:hypothetical protein